MISKLIIQRPADTISYSANDYINYSGVATPIWLPISQNDSVKTVLLKSVNVFINQNTVPTGMTSLRIWFYGKKVSGNFSDNVTTINHSPIFQNVRGYFDTNAFIGQGNFVVSQKTGIEMIYEVADEKAVGFNGNGLWIAVQTQANITSPTANMQLCFNFGFIGVG
jgi:hypothetical protein